MKKLQPSKYYHTIPANNAKVLWTASRFAVSLVQSSFCGQKKGVGGDDYFG